MLFEALDGGHPGGFTDEGREFLDVGLDGGEDLDAGGTGEWISEVFGIRRDGGMRGGVPVTDETYMAASEVDVFVPVCGVEECAFVFFYAGDGGPSPVVQDASSIDENVAVIVDNLSAFEILNLNIISAFLLVPSRTDDLVSCLDEFLQSILRRKIIKIRINLLRTRIHRAPIQLRLKRPCVVVSRYVTRAAGRS